MSSEESIEKLREEFADTRDYAREKAMLAAQAAADAAEVAGKRFDWKLLIAVIGSFLTIAGTAAGLIGMYVKGVVTVERKDREALEQLVESELRGWRREYAADERYEGEKFGRLTDESARQKERLEEMQKGGDE
jgi:hypothetical protein